MSAARSHFCKRIVSIRSSILEFNLQDIPAIGAESIARNDSARVLRNGLVIQCFNTFEDFVRDRIAELLEEIQSSGVAFSTLPTGLQKAATMDVLRAIGFQEKLTSVENRMAFIQEHCRKVSSTNGEDFMLSEISFFHSASNVSKENIKGVLDAFAVQKPWQQMLSLCSRIGVSAMPMENVFKNFSQRRHSAAHRSTTAISEVDLSQSVQDAFALAIGLDALLVCATREIQRGAESATERSYLVPDSTSIPLRFIKFRDGRFGEMREGSRQFYRTSPDCDGLLVGALDRTSRENGVLVIFDSSGALAEWRM